MMPYAADALITRHFIALLRYAILPLYAIDMPYAAAIDALMSAADDAAPCC